jgi:general nucleoside transport system permease protein
VATATGAAGGLKLPRLDYLGAQFLALAGAFLFAAVVGGLIILAYGVSPFFVYATVWNYSTARFADFAQVLEYATPLIFSGLAVSVAFKAGLFNIGVEGQYVIGMMMAAVAALYLDFLPGPLLVPMVMLFSIAGAMVWAAIPAVLKVKTGAHEVVTTIMMNGIAVSLVAWAILNPLKSSGQQTVDLRTNVFPEKALMPGLNETLGVPPSIHLTLLFPIALLACLGVWFFLYRTRLGYEVRAVGSSSGSAEAGGVSIGAAQIKVFLLSGALAGLVGLNHLLGDKGYLGSNYETGLGFAGITVAFLGRNHPAGIPLAAILIGMLLRGEDGIAISTELPTEILIILQGVLILSVVIAYELVRRALNKRRRRELAGEETGTPAEA